MNNRQIMRVTNSLIKKKLIANGFSDLYLFPHLRFMLDYNFGGQGFDAFGWNNINLGREFDDNNKNNNTNEKDNNYKIYHALAFFQFKTGAKPSKQTLLDYQNIEQTYACKCYWVTKVKVKNRVKVLLYDCNGIITEL